MRRFLVVDDSSLSRQVIADLLRKTWEGEVCFAADGVDALEQLERHGPFDLILSDLRMPRLDGLKLLQIVRERFGNLPFVILTAFGSEEIAFHAIQGGAASYIPKQLVPSRLTDVVRTVLSAAGRHHVRRRLAPHFVRQEVEYRLANDLELFAAVVGELLDLADASGTFPQGELTRIGIAVGEALSNAMIHGNLEISSELRARDDGVYEDMIRTRLAEPVFRDRRIQLLCRFTLDELRFEIEDEGRGFDVSQVPDPKAPENYLKPSGRGLLLIRSFMDEVRHNATGNRIALVKRIREPSLETPDSPAGGEDQA